jgi:hypothetical protein
MGVVTELIMKWRKLANGPIHVNCLVWIVFGVGVASMDLLKLRGASG